MANSPKEDKMELFHLIKMHEGFRDYYGSSLWQINHLIQLDPKPNLELKEPRWEIYKISLSFLTKRKLNTNLNFRFMYQTNYLYNIKQVNFIQ